MFRPMQRKKQQLSEEECLQILKSVPRGVLSVVGDGGYPYGVPHNHWYCEEDGRLYFHSGESGHKIDAIRANDKVSYCVFGNGFHQEGDWALSFRSVIVFGRVKLVEDHEKALEICRRLSLFFTEDRNYIEQEIHTSGQHVLVFSIEIEHMSGKLIHEA